ncbi:MAG: polyphosphate polymerase domain-containing protein [Eubacteriales bacterium]|nr:polyphosphate polymerase domain-containing protein [Eubacteriales bacterium]MDD3882001.1 polyphosphate polymerase domain-containing protein [Eubacteriales bacterium]MDD4513721.1 polyphosphate polymerase domain-containing protein [Eubacteriales bacterium]
MPVAVPLRHELKYYINNIEYEVLARTLDSLLSRDPNGDEYNEYHIRSLYFDTVHDDALYDKINGVSHRDKYRIRIYNFSDRMIRLECKSKFGSLISKRSVAIPRDLCEQLMAGDPTGLEHTRSGLLRDMYREMKVNLLKPSVIVDYVREAYIHPAEEVRITFDKQLRTGLNSKELFERWLPTIPVLKNGEIIMEVKYDRALPPYIRSVLQSFCHNAQISAVSKYVICRQFEGKEA